MSTDPQRQVDGIYKTYQQPTMSSELKSRIRPGEGAFQRGTSSKKPLAAAPTAVDKIPVNQNMKLKQQSILLNIES